MAKAKPSPKPSPKPAPKPRPPPPTPPGPTTTPPSPPATSHSPPPTLNPVAQSEWKSIAVSAAVILGVLLVLVLLFKAIFGSSGTSAPASTTAPTSYTSIAAMVEDNRQNITSSDPIMAREARLKLIQAGGHAAKELIEGLASPDQNVRQNSKRALAIIGGEATRSQLVNALGDGRSSVSVGAGDVLLQPEQTMLSADEAKRLAMNADQNATKAVSTSDRARAKSEEAVNTADRAEIKANSAVKIAREALERAETTAKAAEEALSASKSTSNRLDAMEKKLDATKAELKTKIQNDVKLRAEWKKAKAKADTEANNVRVAKANQVRLSTLKLVEDKAAESKKAADEIRTELREEIAALSQLTLTVRWMEGKIAEQEKKAAEAKMVAEAKAKVAQMADERAVNACQEAGLPYATPRCKNGFFSQGFRNCR